MRKIQDIPISKIKIINPRERDPSKFEENVKSIRDVGLKRPVVLNTRYLEKTGMYELVCGQGRIEAYKQIGKTEIPSLLVDVERSSALIMSIAENTTRNSPPPIWFANVVKGLHDSGMTIADISDILGRSTDSVRIYLKLASEGEEILLDAVERGRISISAAFQIAKTPNSGLQKLLLEGVETGLLSKVDIPIVRRMIDNRRRFGKKYFRIAPSSKSNSYTVDQLRKEIKQTLVKQEEFIQKSRKTEYRLMLLSEEFQRLQNDADWQHLVVSEGMIDFPKLKGEVLAGLFNYQLAGGEDNE